MRYYKDHHDMQAAGANAFLPAAQVEKQMSEIEAAAFNRGYEAGFAAAVEQAEQVCYKRPRQFRGDDIYSDACFDCAAAIRDLRPEGSEKEQ